MEYIKVRKQEQSYNVRTQFGIKKKKSRVLMDQEARTSPETRILNAGSRGF